MKIGIYAPYLSVYGGGEKYISNIAEILSSGNKVEFIVVEEPDIKQLENRLNVDLSRVVINRVKIPNLFSKVPYLRDLANIYVISKATRKYDLFINQEHLSVIPSLAKKGFLICQMPVIRLNKLSWLFRKLFANLLFDPKLKTYDKIIVYSFYTKKWVEKNYRNEIEILYPAVDTQQFPTLSKQNIILSVGRFFTVGHCKKQLEMIRSFKQFYTGSEMLRGWEYHLVGGIGSNDKDQEYLRRCQDEAQSYPIHFHINIPFKLLKELYVRAKIFWHATGLGEDEDRHPDRMEHFGMTTVEAMSAGCVPVVINKGGQPEIVRNNVDGFLWNAIEELREYTLRLASNETLWTEMSESSIKRSKEFNMERFKREIKQILAC